jgi:hypothetical protein
MASASERGNIRVIDPFFPSWENMPSHMHNSWSLVFPSFAKFQGCQVLFHNSWSCSNLPIATEIFTHQCFLAQAMRPFG